VLTEASTPVVTTGLTSDLILMPSDDVIKGVGGQELHASVSTGNHGT